MRKFALRMIGVGLVLLVAFGCGSDDDNNPGPGSGNGRLHVRLTDAPNDYDSIVVFIREIAVHRTGTDSTSWLTFIALSPSMTRSASTGTCPASAA